MINAYAIINISIVFLFGCFFGFAEIFQRHKSLKYNFKLPVSYVYIVLNGVVAIAALLVIRYMRYPADTMLYFCNIEITELFWAGFGGMMILRSSIFSIRNDKQEIVEIGLAPIFQIFLDGTERNMRNRAAAIRLEKISEIMKDVDFALAIQGLPVICSAFIDRFSDDEQEMLFKEVQRLVEMKISDEEKSLLLGERIASYCDEDILAVAVERYKEQFNEAEILKGFKILEKYGV